MEKLLLACQHKDVAVAKQLFKSLSVSDFGSDSRERFKRITVLAKSKIFENSDLVLSLLVLPPDSIMPLHSQPGSVDVKQLFGPPIFLREEEILSVEDAREQGKVLSGNFGHDGFIQEVDEDCVCRGGMCPRRYGCVFWVEKQLRDNGKYLKTALHETALRDCSGTSSSVFSRSQAFGPREFVGGSGANSAVLELICVEEDVSIDQLKTQYYIRGGTGSDDDRRVTIAENPVGYRPMHIPFTW